MRPFPPKYAYFPHICTHFPHIHKCTYFHNTYNINMNERYESKLNYSYSISEKRRRNKRSTREKRAREMPSR